MPPLRIAIVEPAGHDNSLGSFYERAFRKLGQTVGRFAPVAALSPWPGGSANLIRRIVRALGLDDAPALWHRAFVAVAAFRPDLIIFTRCETAPAEAIERLKDETGSPCWNIYTDHPLAIPGRAAIRMAPFYGVFSVLFTNDRNLIPVFQQLGAGDVRWLPFGYDPDVHRPVPCAGMRSGIAYIGGWGPLVETWLEPLVPLGLRIYGPGWHRLSRYGPLAGCWCKYEGWGRDMTTALARHWFAVNLARAEHGCAVTMKPFEIAACGSFCLMNDIPEAKQIFVPDRDFVYFSGKDQMVAQARSLLSDPGTCTRLMAAAHRRGRSCSYDHRARVLLDFEETGRYIDDAAWFPPDEDALPPAR
ncbi:MAG: glycosyltransferase [Rhodospirillaceae bacterium]